MKLINRCVGLTLLQYHQPTIAYIMDTMPKQPFSISHNELNSGVAKPSAHQKTTENNAL